MPNPATNRLHHSDCPWHFRGYLPHYDSRSVIQAVTFRLADSFPPAVQQRLRSAKLGPLDRSRDCEVSLDQGHGLCLLRRPENAGLMISTWEVFHGSRYHLHAWIVMPNHVHVLVEPFGTYSLQKIIHSWKSFTAKRMMGADALLASHGRVWQPEYFDRFIRDEKHYHAAVDYIHRNPMKAGLVANPEEWEWSSARSWRDA
jgi:putative DNA methylase